MKAATLHELKKELNDLDPSKLSFLCLHLAKYKKDNKELLTYLLFEADDENNFVQSVKSEVDLHFETINRANLYWTKKGIRKALRYMDKFIRYSGNKESEVELRIYYCEKLKEENIPFEKSKVMLNMYNRQIQKIKNALATLHEDLQADYSRVVDELEVNT